MTIKEDKAEERREEKAEQRREDRAEIKRLEKEAKEENIIISERKEEREAFLQNLQKK